MTQIIYKHYIGRMTEAWHKLPEQDQKALLAKVEQSLEKAGGKVLIECDSSWCNEHYNFWGVEQFPDIEAVMAHTMALNELNWDRYVDTTTVLGTKR